MLRNFASRSLIGLALITAALTSGCVTGRRSFDLAVPQASSRPQETKGAFSIDHVTDARTFENHPSDPSTPSVNGDVRELSDAARSRFIGRQRNSFGHAMGDITLPEPETVQSKVAGLVTEGLERRGYQVLHGAGGPRRIDVTIDQFWAWTTPGFWALSFEAHVRCRLTIHADGKEQTLDVRGYALNHGQFAKNKNWQEAYDECFADFLKDLDRALAENGW